MHRNAHRIKLSINQVLSLAISFLLVSSLLPVNAFADQDFTESSEPTSQPEEQQPEQNRDSDSSENDNYDSALDKLPLLDQTNQADEPEDGTTMDSDSTNRDYANAVQDFHNELSSAATGDIPSQTEELALQANNIGDSLAEGIYLVRPAMSNHRVLDVKTSSTKDMANVQLYQSNMSSAQRFIVKQGQDGFYTITNINSNRLLDVAGAGKKSGTNVWQYHSNNTNAQKWSLQYNSSRGSYVIESALQPDLVLDISGSNDSNSTNVQVWKRNGSKAQSFFFIPINPTTLPASNVNIAEGLYTIANLLSPRRMLDISGASKSAGAQLQIYNFNSTAAQTFDFKLVANGLYSIRPLNSGLAISSKDSNLVATTPVVQAAIDNSSLAQLWAAVDAGAGTVSFVNAASGLYLDIQGANPAGATPLTVYYGNGTNAQRFKLAPRPVTKGYYTITSAIGERALDVSAGSMDNAANVQIYQQNGTGAQIWQLIPFNDGNFVILNAQSSRTLDVVYANSADGTNVHQFEYNGNAAQKWTFTTTSDGWLTISALGKNLAVENGLDANGANIIINSADGSDAQKFRLTPTSYSRANYNDIRASLSHQVKPIYNQKYIVLHDTEMLSTPGQIIDWWDGNGRQVATHYIVGLDGQIVQVLELNRVAWHMGNGDPGKEYSMGVVGGMNNYSIGIEMVHVTGMSYYPEAQLKAVDQVIASIDKYFGFKSAIIDHKTWISSNSDTSKEFADYLRNYQKTRKH